MTTVMGGGRQFGKKASNECEFGNPIHSVDSEQAGGEAAFDKEEGENASNGKSTALKGQPSGDDTTAVDKMEQSGLKVMPESLEGAEWMKQKAQNGPKWLDNFSEPKENERDRRRRLNLEYLDKSGLFAPDCTFRRRWDVAQLILVIYVALGVPYRLGFDRPVQLWSFPWFWVDLMVDIYFIVDIIVALRTAFYSKSGELIVLKQEIRNHYIKRSPYWFFIDVAACFPGSYIEWYMLCTDVSCNSLTGDTEDQQGNANKMLRLMRMLRLLKLLRLLRLNRLMQKYEEELQEFMKTLRVWKILIGMAVVGHWMACFWYWAGSEGSNEQETCAADDGPTSSTSCTGWVDRRFGEGAAARNGSTTGGATPEVKRYFASVYWSVMTMTTVGYGDVVPETATEVIVAIIGMVIGGFMFGMIVGNLAEVARQSDAENLMRERALSKVSSMLNCGIGNGVPRDLQRRVRTYFISHYRAKTHMNLLHYMMEMHVELRNELAVQFHWIDSEREGSGRVFGILHKVRLYSFARAACSSTRSDAPTLVLYGSAASCCLVFMYACM